MIHADIDNAQQLRTELLYTVQQKLGPACVETVRYACDLAERAHCGQKRDEGTPYVTHPLRVALKLASDLQAMESDAAFSKTEIRRDVIVISLLHDVLEDSPTALGEDDWRKLGATVHDAVRQLTRSKETDKREYLRRLSECPLHVRLVKLADRLDNLRYIDRTPKNAKRAKILIETQNDILPWALASQSPLVTAYGAAMAGVIRDLAPEGPPSSRASDKGHPVPGE